MSMAGAAVGSIMATLISIHMATSPDHAMAAGRVTARQSAENQSTPCAPGCSSASATQAASVAEKTPVAASRRGRSR